MPCYLYSITSQHPWLDSKQEEEEVYGSETIVLYVDYFFKNKWFVKVLK